MLSGRYFSGQGARSHEATLRREGEGVVVSYAGHLEGEEALSVRVSVAEVSITERLKGVPRRLTLGERGVFETRDDEGVERLFKTEPIGGLIARLELSPRVALWSAGGLVGVALLAYYVLLPLAASLIARATPQGVREVMDSSYIESLKGFRVFEPSTLTEEERAPFASVISEVSQGSGLPFVSIELLDSKIGANALALPGGHVLVTSDLVRLVTPEELRAVLYHELGHVALNHGLEAIIKQAGVSLFVLALFGFDDINALAQALLTSSYSRDAEREADHFAAARLRAEGRSPALLARALQKMVESSRRGEEGEGDAEGVSAGSLLSSHPLTDERVRYLLGE